MKARLTLQRGIVMGLLCFAYAHQVPGLLRQGLVGVPALIVGGLIVIAIVWGLIKRSAGLALALGLVAVLSSIIQPVVFFLGTHRELPAFDLAISEGVAMVAAFCLLDLASEWKKPNHLPP